MLLSSIQKLLVIRKNILFELRILHPTPSTCFLMVGLALPWIVLFCQIAPSSYTNDVKLGVRQVFKPIKKLTVRIKTNIWMAVIFQVEIIMHLSITGESCVLERRGYINYYFQRFVIQQGSIHEWRHAPWLEVVSHFLTRCDRGGRVDYRVLSY